jgi:hypothetical protein
MGGTHKGRVVTAAAGRSPRPLALVPLLSILIATSAGAEEAAPGWAGIEALLTGAPGAPTPSPSAGPMSWGDIAQFLEDPGTENAPAGPSLAEQLRTLSEGLARFDGSPNATGALPFADLRTGGAHLTARHPLLSSGYESGTGAVSQPIALGAESPVSLELGHVAQSSLTLAASENQLGAQIENRSFTQVVANLGRDPHSQLSLILGQSTVDRQQSAGYAYDDPYGYYTYGSYGRSNRAGKTDSTGLALEWSALSGMAELKAGFARSTFFAPSPLDAMGFEDPLAALREAPEQGDAHYFDLALTPWHSEDGLLQLKIKQSESEEEFSGSGGWDYASAGSERSIAAEGRWRWLSLRVDSRERLDEAYCYLTDQSSGSANVTLDWLDLSLSRRLYESVSEYTYLAWIYGQDPGDYWSGSWVPLKIENVRSTVTDSGAASLHGKSWSVDLDWTRSDGAYSYGENSESTQRSSEWNASASYEFGLIGLQASLSQSDDVYGVEPDPVVSARTEGGLTLSFDFDQSGHHYSSGGYGGYGGYYGAPYGGYGGASGGYDPASEFPWLAPGGPLPGGAPGYPYYPQPSMAGLPLAPAAIDAQGKDKRSLLAGLLPSSARIGLRQGVASEEDGDDGLDGLPPIFTNSLSEPLGPYYAVEGGLGWRGAAGSTDLSLRVTLATGDERSHAAGGISYEAGVSHQIQTGPLSLGASLDGSISRFEQPSEVDSELYATASLYGSYVLGWLTFDARAYGVLQETAYADAEPYASTYANIQLGAQMTLDPMLPAAWRRTEAPPYLRLRGYLERNYAENAYASGLTGSAGVILFGGMRF